MAAWLMKSEPGAYSLADLERDGRTRWDGVRNYQARNFLRDAVRAGDRVLFYHSNAEPPGVAGIAKVVRGGYPDPRDPTWACVDLAFDERFPRFVPLEAMKAEARLTGMLVLRRGMRLSVQPVEESHFGRVLVMGREP